MFRKCKYCGKDLNEFGAEFCPHCNKKQNIPIWQGCLVIIFVLFGAFFLAFAIPSSKDKVYNENKDEIKIENNTNGPYDENNINKSVTCNNRKITFKKIQRVNKSINDYVKEGHEWIGVYVIYRNVGQEDIDYVETDFHLLNGNKNVLNPVYNVISGVFDHERLNNGTLATGGIAEGYIEFDNEIIGDNNLSVRFTCEEKFLADDKIVTIELK